MPFSLRFPLTILVPPLLLAVPVALWFLVTTAGFAPGVGVRVCLVALLFYAAGALVAGRRMSRDATAVAGDLQARRDPSESLSRALEGTTRLGAVLWIALGFTLAIAGTLAVDRTFLGMQYFVEAALLVAAPSMAWSYWGGKSALLREADGVPHIAYRGRVWSIGVKIAIVFVGFFFAAAGAIVLVISSRVAEKLGTEAAYAAGRAGFLIAIVAAAAFAAATWFLAHDIIRPMNELVHLADEMARGRFSTDPRVFADDEAGKVAGSFAVTQRNLRTLLGRIGEGGQAVTGGVRQMTSGTEALVQNVHVQSSMAEKADEALALVRREAEAIVLDAEQVTRFTTESAGSITELRASFASVGREMDELFQSVEKSSSAATQIDAAARETASTTSSLASIGADVLAFVAQMEATIGQIMATAQSTASISQQVRENALAGGAAVDATVAGIRTVQESTRRTAGTFEALQRSLGQIDQILLFIDDVTNRTNLLSLNAAIIAAQAGAHDYGFSVIADEVRQLADRTRDATKEIAQIVRNVQPVATQAVDALQQGVKDVDRTVALAQNASSSLSAILESADRSLDMSQSMSTALAEQASASRYLHDVTARMSENIVEMRRATEGQAESTRMLAVEAEHVSSIASQVKRATEEQMLSVETIVRAVEQIAEGVLATRDRLRHQLHQAEQVAIVSGETLRIAEQNSGIADQFRASLDTLLESGRRFEAEVSRYKA